MKRIGNIFNRLISDENIINAINDVNRGHRWCGNHLPNKTVLWVETTIDERVKELRNIIINGFEPTQPKIKRRYDKNAKKWRDIAEPKLYPDQYIHHILIQAIKPVLLRGMDKYCCGSLEGRGTYYGIKAIKKWMKEDWRGTRYCAELDIYHFYEQLKPEIVMNRMKCLIKDNKVLDLIERVLKYGVTIGAYFSQWFANTVLQPLDQIIHICGVNHYLRYMDNFTIFASSKKAIKKVMRHMTKWLESHNLSLKDNWQYYPTKCRLVNALGYRFAHEYTLIRKHRLIGIKRQIKSFYKQRGKVSFKFACALLSRLGGLRHCNSQNIYKKYVPKGLQKKLKDIVREYQRREMKTWNMCLAQYTAMV